MAMAEVDTPWAESGQGRWSRRKCRRLIVAVMFVFVAEVGWRRELHRHRRDDAARATSAPPALPACTEEASSWPRPAGLAEVKYRSVRQAEGVLAFLVSRLDGIGAPLTLMYGTMLREFRGGGPGPCLRPDHADKDFDVVVFPAHFLYILTLEAEILERFKWTIHLSDESKRRMYAKIVPLGVLGNFFQVDVYGFECGEEREHVYFPWDMITVARNGFLPVKKHKRIVSRNATTSNSASVNATNRTARKRTPAFYMPRDPSCLLHNLYGPDYMTPKSGPSSQAKWGTEHGRPAYGNPKCDPALTPRERSELEGQLAFCSPVAPA